MSVKQAKVQPSDWSNSQTVCPLKSLIIKHTHTPLWRYLYHMCLRQQCATTENSHKNDNDAEEDSENKSKGQEWLLISAKLEALDCL